MMEGGKPSREWNRTNHLWLMRMLTVECQMQNVRCNLCKFVLQFSPHNNTTTPEDLIVLFFYIYICLINMVYGMVGKTS